MIGYLIIGCEIGFWIFVLLGLVCRYMLRARRASLFFLYSTPIIDLVLLAATLIDLRNGATAGAVHGIAAIYIGVSIVMGHGMIRWADARFAYWFAGGPKPEKPVKYGKEHAARERKGWLQHLGAWLIGCALLYGMILLVGDGERTEALNNMIRIWSLVLAIDCAISFSYTIWPRPYKGSSVER